MALVDNDEAEVAKRSEESGARANDNPRAGGYRGVFGGRVARSRRHGARALILGRNLRKPPRNTLVPTPSQ